MSEVCRCWEDLEYVSSSACEADLRENAEMTFAQWESNPDQCQCLMGFVDEYRGVVSDYQGCVSTVADEWLTCSSRAACGTGRHEECNRAYGDALTECFDRYFTETARSEFTACTAA